MLPLRHEARITPEDRSGFFFGHQWISATSCLFGQRKEDDHDKYFVPLEAPLTPTTPRPISLSCRIFVGVDSIFCNVLKPQATVFRWFSEKIPFRRGTCPSNFHRPPGSWVHRSAGLWRLVWFSGAPSLGREGLLLGGACLTAIGQRIFRP